MTNLDYITKSLSGLNVSSDDIEIIMVKAGIDGNAPVNIDACDNAIYNRMIQALTVNMQHTPAGAVQ